MYRDGNDLTAFGLGLGAVLAVGHARAMEGVQRGREERATRQQAFHDACIEQELVETQASLSKARREIARLQAEVDRLQFWNEILKAPVPSRKTAR